jgi:hypothetical protein
MQHDPTTTPTSITSQASPTNNKPITLPTSSIIPGCCSCCGAAMYSLLLSSCVCYSHPLRRRVVVEVVTQDEDAQNGPRESDWGVPLYVHPEFEKILEAVS